jgi:hypothetical protein
MRGATCDRTCSYCLGGFTARVADVQRGWARYCSKSCKAKAQAAGIVPPREPSRPFLTAAELDFADLPGPACPNGAP